MLYHSSAFFCAYVLNNTHAYYTKDTRTVLHFLTVLLARTIQYYTTLHYTLLYYGTLYHTSSHYVTPHSTTPHYTTYVPAAFGCAAVAGALRGGTLFWYALADRTVTGMKRV